MDSSFIQSQHPVVEELLTNKYFGDTLLVCANGHLTDNKLAVGLLFPALLTSDIFALPIENVLLVPDYTMEEIGREFEKLILGGSINPKPGEGSQEQTGGNTSTAPPIPPTANQPQHSTTTTAQPQPKSSKVTVSNNNTAEQNKESNQASNQSVSKTQEQIPVASEVQQYDHSANILTQQQQQQQQQQQNMPGMVYMTPVHKADSRQAAPAYQSAYNAPAPTLITCYDRPPDTQLQNVVPHHDATMHHLPTPAPTMTALPSAPIPMTHPGTAVPLAPANLQPHPHHQHQTAGAPSVYTTQYNIVTNTVPYPSTNANSVQYQSTNANTVQYPSTNTVAYSSQPYNNTVQYQELRSIAPAVDVQTVQQQQQPVLRVQSVYTPVTTTPVNNQQMVEDMGDRNSEDMSYCIDDTATSESAATYTDLSYSNTPQYILSDNVDQDDNREEPLEDEYEMYNQNNSQDMLRNGYTEKCANTDTIMSNIHMKSYYSVQENKNAEVGAGATATIDVISPIPPATKKKSVTFKEPIKQKARRGRSNKQLPVRIEECEDNNVQMIENLRDKDEPQVVEERKPGRPRVKPRPSDQSTTNHHQHNPSKFKMRSAENVHKGKYKCGECGKVLSCQSSLNRHILVHSETKPFKCKFCSKSFRESSKKLTHERVHTGSKPFLCSLCSQSFRTATQRRVHMFKHTKESPWTCEVCKRKFAQQCTLKKHKQKSGH